ncbi:hypothetical protein ACWGHD_25055 [Streptomyces xanthophaeus]
MSKLISHLRLDLGWQDTYQKATVRYHAMPYYWDALAWFNERLSLADEYKPRVKGTLTLTGPPTLTAPEGKVISTEEITVKASKLPYPLDFTREFPLADLPPGTYTLTLANAVKTGGKWSNQYATTIKLKDHTLTFAVGR